MGLRPQHFKKKLSSRLIKREDLQMSIRHVPICFSLVNWGASWPRHAALRPAKASLRGTGRRKVQGRLRQNVPGHTGDRRWPGPDLTSDLPRNIRVTADVPFPVSGAPRDLSPVSGSRICGGKTVFFCLAGEAGTGGGSSDIQKEWTMCTEKTAQFPVGCAVNYTENVHLRKTYDLSRRACDSRAVVMRHAAGCFPLCHLMLSA